MNTTFLKSLCLLLLSVCGLEAQSLINLTFQNKSSRNVDIIYQSARGKFQKFETLRPGRSYVQQSYAGQTWAMADSTTQKIVKSHTAATRNQAIEVTDRDFPSTTTTPPALGGHGHGGHHDNEHGNHHGHDHADHPHSNIKLFVLNESAHVLRVYQNAHNKRTLVTSVPAHKNATIEAFPNERFEIEDSASKKILQSVSIQNKSISIPITETDFHGSVQPPVSVYLSIYNRSADGLRLIHMHDGRPEVHSRIRGHQSVTVKTFSGETWMVEESKGGKRIKTVTAGRRSSTIDITENDVHGHHQEPITRQPQTPQLFGCTFTNQTPHAVNVYKGQKLHQKVAPWKSLEVQTYTGESWRVQDDYSKANLKEMTANSRNTSAFITQDDFPNVTAQIINQTPGQIHIYEVQQGGTEKYKKKVSPGRYYRLKTHSGQHIIARDATTQRVVKSFYAPALDGDVMISDAATTPNTHGHSHGTGTHQHGNTDSDYHYKTPERGQPPVEEYQTPPKNTPSPRDLLRRLFKL